MNCRRLIGLLPRTSTPYHIIEWELCFAANLDRQCLRWVKRRTTQTEHNTSAYPPIADIRANIVDGRKVPTGDVPQVTAKVRSALQPVKFLGPLPPKSAPTSSEIQLPF